METAKAKNPHMKKSGAIAAHIGHCCYLHGCKYGDGDCPVFLRTTKQEFLCEICEESGHWTKELPKITGIYWLASKDGRVVGTAGFTVTAIGVYMSGPLSVPNRGGWPGWFWSKPCTQPLEPMPWD